MDIYSKLLSESHFEQDLFRLIEKCGSLLEPLEFIETVSNVYHDLESDIYDNQHPEINIEEVMRLKRFLANALSVYKGNELRIIDIGCGTGYLTQIMFSECQSITGTLPQLVCLEPSKDMLSLCQHRLNSYNTINFIAGNIDAVLNQLEYHQHFDIVVTSSLLHHIPNIYTFGEKVSKLLSPSGQWLMLHEPSAKFYSNHFLLSAMHAYRRVIQLQTRLLRRIKKWRKITASENQTKHKPHILDLTSQVLRERAVTPLAVLSRREVRGLVDIHTRNAHPGNFTVGYDGFDRHQLATAYSLFGMNLVHYESYMHLGLVKNKGKVARILEYAFQKVWPNDGLLFSAIWQKAPLS